MTQETWRDVPGYEGLYLISDKGRVLSLPRTDARGRVIPGGLRKVMESHNGRGTSYCSVTLSKQGHTKTFWVHSLVLRAFVGPCPPGKECAHNNGDGLDNDVSNLRWATPSENSRDRIKHGTQTRKANWTKITPRQALAIRKAVSEGATQASQCRKYGLSDGYVCQLVHGAKGRTLCLS